ncbi:peptidoglycan-binding protein [Aquicoccus sp. SCR17]|nr:peptidoglycan-binding protein [Carideicomes alvinocaridis]
MKEPRRPSAAPRCRLFPEPAPRPGRFSGHMTWRSSSLKRIILAALMGSVAAAPAFARDVALILGNGDYEELDDVSRGDRAVAAEQALRDAGFTVIAEADAARVEMRDALARFLSASEEPGKRLVVLSGAFAHSRTESYLLPVDAEPGVTLLDAQDDALALSTVMAVLAETPGQALLLLGAGEASGELGPYLTAGPGETPEMQGVGVLRGTPRQIGSFARRVLPEPGAQIRSEAERYDLAPSGYLPRDMVLVTEASGAEPVIERPDPSDGDEAEAQLWSEASRRDNIDAYETYLRVYPEGPHAAEAAQAIEALRAEPEREARLTEEALDLSRNARREIQRDLQLLEYDTRGIDGIFGPGTRQAVARWQAANGLAETSYLTGNQIAMLDDQAQARATELEEEARRRQEEQERRDRAYWDETGAAGDEAGLRSYLDRYPDGVYAEVAQERLDEIVERQRQQAEARDREAWVEAETRDSVEGYRDYLEGFPEGAFAATAQERIDRMTRPAEEVQAEERAQQREAALGMNQTTWRLVEDRLEKLGLKPGRVDGNFDLNTRRALRRYQSARNLQVTGYMDQDTVVRLLADAILR